MTNKDTYSMNHKLVPVPTAVGETFKIIEEANTTVVTENLDDYEKEIEEKKIAAVIPISNKAPSRKPLVKLVSLEEKTFKVALNKLLQLQNIESFEAIVLLYEYMEIKKNFKIDKLTGTELLKFSGYKNKPTQSQRHRILNTILNHSTTIIDVLDPEATEKNRKNKNTEAGKVYRRFYFLKVNKIHYSNKNPDLIVALEDIEFLPEYINFSPIISRRYLPLEQLRKISKTNSTDKSRYFLTKICFKFASIKGKIVSFTLEECMNLGKFFHKDRNMQKSWKPIENALFLGIKQHLLKFKWIFRKPIELEINKDNLQVNSNGEIIIKGNDLFSPITLEKQYYKYIKSVILFRTYTLKYVIDLPFNIENQKPIKSIERVAPIC